MPADGLSRSVFRRYLDAGGWLPVFRNPPRARFHGNLAVIGVVVLWAFSFPGIHVPAVILCVWVIAGSALVWVVRGATYLTARRQQTHVGSAWWFTIAPVGTVALAALLLGSVPLRARWQLSKTDFAAALRSVHADPAEWTRWRERRIGTYRITHVELVDRGVIFHDRVGSLFDDAGFAYLPGGPTPDMENGNFENPQWFPLGDHWYAWTASW